MVLFNPKGDKGVHAIPKGISPRVNVMIWLDFELAYFKATVQHFSHYATETLPDFDEF